MSEAAAPRPFFLFRPKFLMFVIYVIGYLFLRSNGMISKQSVALPGSHGVEVFHMIGVNPDLPHWQTQLWRALFTFAMVCEEEGEKWYVIGRAKLDEARGQRGPGGPGGPDRRERSIIQEIGDKVRQYTDSVPPQQQQGGLRPGNQQSYPQQPGYQAQQQLPNQQGYYPQQPQQQYPQQYPQQPQQQYQQYPQQQQQQQQQYQQQPLQNYPQQQQQYQQYPQQTQPYGQNQQVYPPQSRSVR